MLNLETITRYVQKSKEEIFKKLKEKYSLNEWTGKSAEYRNYQKKKPNENAGLKITEIQNLLVVLNSRLVTIEESKLKDRSLGKKMKKNAQSLKDLWDTVS